MKKAVLLMISAALLCGLLSGCGSEQASARGGKKAAGVEEVLASQIAKAQMDAAKSETEEAAPDSSEADTGTLQNSLGEKPIEPETQAESSLHH